MENELTLRTEEDSSSRCRGIHGIVIPSEEEVGDEGAKSAESLGEHYLSGPHLFQWVG
jgi:hypothetical protein